MASLRQGYEKTGFKHFRPAYFNLIDRIWIEQLRDVYINFLGRPQCELAINIPQHHFNGASLTKLKIVRKILDSHFFPPVKEKKTTIIENRRKIFLQAQVARIASAKAHPENTLKKCHSTNKNILNKITKYLYVDLQAERIVTQPKEEMELEDVVSFANHLLIKKFVLKCEKIRIFIQGSSRPIVRHAKLKGLICSVKELQGYSGVLLEISGPLAVVEKTKFYGQAMSEFLPFLPYVNSFVFEAKKHEKGEALVLKVKTGDPIFPRKTGKKFDSKLEEKFAKAFTKATDDWDLIREPRPFKSCDSLIFPDFAILHRIDQKLFWYLEIVGFWTEEYIRTKQEKYRNANIDRLIFCIRGSKNISNESLPKNAVIVRFKTVIFPKDILEIINGNFNA